MTRTRIKICGLTRASDAALAAELGADALGVVFAHSRRRVDVAAAAMILAGAGGFVTRVGVFADQPLAFILAAIERCRLDRVQLAGTVTDELLVRMPVPVIRTVHVTSARTIELPPLRAADSVLLDSPPIGAQRGGTGRTFDWRAAAALPRSRTRVGLAGGLTPANVGDAILRVRPHAVDVSSGVESAAGIKDPVLLRAFFAAVAAADAAVADADVAMAADAAGADAAVPNKPAAQRARDEAAAAGAAAEVTT